MLVGILTALLPPIFTSVMGHPRQRNRAASPSQSPARPAEAVPKPLRVMLHSHSWAHCDGVAIRYKAHARELHAQGHRVALSLSAQETDPSAGFVDASLALAYGSRVPCSDGPVMPMVRAFVFAHRAHPYLC